jgi:hypothetical protein
MRTCASYSPLCSPQTALVQTLQSQPTQLATFAETLMCRVVPEVPKDKLVLSTADPKRPAAYQAPLIIPTCPSKDAQLDAATASAQSLDLQLHHHTHLQETRFCWQQLELPGVNASSGGRQH